MLHGRGDRWRYDDPFVSWKRVHDDLHEQGYLPHHRLYEKLPSHVHRSGYVHELVHRPDLLSVSSTSRGAPLYRALRPDGPHATRLPFDDASFDRCAASRLLQHLEHPSDALAEMVRVARPGARILISDSDWGTAVIDGSDRQLSERIRAIGVECIKSGTVGRQLYAMFHDVGLVDVCVTPKTLVITDFAIANDLLLLPSTIEAGVESGVLSRDETNAWLRDLEERSHGGRFFASVSGFLAVGRKAEAEGIAARN
jgi:SAM-dependent methyltransferase